MTDEPRDASASRARRAPGERRVALVPEIVRRIVATGRARHRRARSRRAGDDLGRCLRRGRRRASTPTGPGSADVVVKVSPPSIDEVARLRRGSVLIGFLAPATSPELLAALTAAGVTAFALESIPRISRAQSMDALSSQATVAGYRGALLAADHLTRFFPMLTTAAGTVPPARVLVMGAGVAGLAGARRRAAPGRSHDRLRRASRSRRPGPFGRRELARRSAASRRPARAATPAS